MSDIPMALQLITAGGLPAPAKTFEEAKSARMALEAKVSGEVYRELTLMVGEKLRRAQHDLIDAEHGHARQSGDSVEELSMRVDKLRDLHELYKRKSA